ncbi:MAG: hypothetical protein HY260_03275 [Chloroflexi bacterium]|nr:hypothetical protein [Chloroflexota bacterium]
MPQVYWEQAHNPDEQLQRTVKEFSDPALVGTVRPIIPAGAAYGIGTWEPTPEDILLFRRTAAESGLQAVSFYSWDWAGAPGRESLWIALTGVGQ